MVDFDTDELVRKCIASLNSKLHVSRIYFKAETGTMDTIHCAREHFKAISSDSVVYDAVDSYKSLMEKIMQ